MTDRDPLLQNTDNARLLFKAFSETSHGFSSFDVVNASLNMVVNAIRQAEPNRQGASDLWDELTVQAKNLLMDGYDSSGRKKGIYSFTQTLVVNPVNFRMKKPG